MVETRRENDCLTRYIVESKYQLHILRKCKLLHILSTDAAGSEANFAIGLTDEEYEGAWMWKTGESTSEEHNTVVIIYYDYWFVTKLTKLTRTGQDVGPVHLARRVRPVRLVIRWKANLSVELRSDIDCIPLSTLALQGQG